MSRHLKGEIHHGTFKKIVLYGTPRQRLSAGTVGRPVQAGEAASLADVCPSADIRARCSGRIARKDGHLLGAPLLASQSRLKGTGS